MALDYLCFAGIPIVNNCATVAYAANGVRSVDEVHGCGCCPDLYLALDDDPYLTPAGVLLGGVDAAPWVDASEPDSLDFAGLLVTDITGLDAAPFSRPVIDVAQGGAVLGRGRVGARTIVVTGVLIGKTCCAVDYGLRWLTSMLRGSCESAAGQAGCAGDDLRYYTCCPQQCADIPPGPLQQPAVEQCFRPYRRTLHRVALVSGPEVISVQGTGCGACNSCPVSTVQFTLVAGEPYAYSDPFGVLGDTLYPVPAPDCPTWTPVPAGTACVRIDPCAPPPDCTLDPNCPQPAAPPSAPLVLNPCSCEPLNRSMICADVVPGALPGAAEGVPIITIYAGATALRNVVITFYTNPLGLSPDTLDPCGACTQITVAYIPPSGTLVLDGTVRRATITCPGGAPTAASTVVGGGARPFSWPVLDCANVNYSVCITASTETVSPDTYVTMSIAARHS